MQDGEQMLLIARLFKTFLWYWMGSPKNIFLELRLSFWSINIFDVFKNLKCLIIFRSFWNIYIKDENIADKGVSRNILSYFAPEDFLEDLSNPYANGINMWHRMCIINNWYKKRACDACSWYIYYSYYCQDQLLAN